MAYEEQHQIVAEEEQRQKELMEKRKAELSQLLEEVEKTEQAKSRKASIPTASHSGRTSQQSRHRTSTESDRQSVENSLFLWLRQQFYFNRYRTDKKSSLDDCVALRRHFALLLVFSNWSARISVALKRHTVVYWLIQPSSVFSQIFLFWTKSILKFFPSFLKKINNIYFGLLSIPCWSSKQGGSTVIGSTLIDDNRSYSPKTNGSASKIEKTGKSEETGGKTRRPSIAGKALSAMKRSFNIKSGKTTPRKWLNVSHAQVFMSQSP